MICKPNSETEFLTETATFYALKSKTGATIISKRHCIEYFDLTDREKIGLAIILERCRDLLELGNYQVIFEGQEVNNPHFKAKLIEISL